MQNVQVQFSNPFRVLAGNGRAQAAEMTIAPGASEGGSNNRHRGSDQWLYVSAGTGSATIAGRAHALRPGVLLLIEQGETHEIRNEGNEPLRTLNFYLPPAYDKDGEALPRGES